MLYPKCKTEFASSYIFLFTDLYLVPKMYVVSSLSYKKAGIIKLKSEEETAGQLAQYASKRNESPLFL